jgi:hypothetical protein
LFVLLLFFHNSKALGESKALQVLITELYIVKYFTIGRLLQKSKGKGPNASFDLVAEVGRAVGMGSPSAHRGGHGNSKTPRIHISKPIWEATAIQETGASSKYQIFEEKQCVG